MKIKFLSALGLAAFMGLAAAGCRTAANTNVTNINTNTNMAVSTPMTATPMTTEAKDATAETAVKAALDKAGYKDVTVEATASKITLRGTVAKAKLGEVIKIATDTGKRKIDNQISVSEK
jgi:osmotically-inducible protein OsmY